MNTGLYVKECSRNTSLIIYDHIKGLPKKYIFEYMKSFSMSHRTGIWMHGDINFSASFCTSFAAFRFRAISQSLETSTHLVAVIIVTGSIFASHGTPLLRARSRLSISTSARAGSSECVSETQRDLKCIIANWDTVSILLGEYGQNTCQTQWFTISLQATWRRQSSLESKKLLQLWLQIVQTMQSIMFVFKYENDKIPQRNLFIHDTKTKLFLF